MLCVMLGEGSFVNIKLFLCLFKYSLNYFASISSLNITAYIHIKFDNSI